MSDIPVGLCQCGCGGKTRIAEKTNTFKGWIKGNPKRFINGHNGRIRLRDKNFNWKGGKYNHQQGYVMVLQADNPNANCNGYIPEHVLIAEKILGEPLPPGAVVHHIDNNPKNNISSNLVICENNSFHLLLHRRQRAFKSCGHADWRKCNICHKYDDLAKMHTTPGGNIYHINCRRKYDCNRQGR